MLHIFSHSKYTIFFAVFCFFLSLPIYSLESARDYLEQAKKHMDSFEYFEATGALQKALKANPYYNEAQILLGDAYFAMGNYSPAWEIYLLAEKKDPNNAELLIKIAQTKLNLAKNRTEIQAAEYYLKKAYKIAPRNSSVVVVYGEFYMKLNNYNKAMEYYESLGNILDDTRIYINKSNIYQYWGQDEKALNELKKAEKINSRDYNILLELGKVYAKLNENSKALIYLGTAYSLNPRDRGVLQALTELYIKENNFADASHKISQLILNDSSNPVLYYNLALCYEALGDFQKAVEVLEQGLQFDFSNEFLRIKAEEIAIKQLPLSSPERAHLAEFYKNNAKTLLANNKEEMALLFLKRALRLEPLNAKTRMDIALIYRKNSFLYEYLRLLQGGIFLNPQNTELMDQLKLNQKFIFNSLENKEKLDPQPFIELEPVLKIQDAIVADKSYKFFTLAAQEVFLETLMNKHSLNVFMANKNNTKEAEFNIRLQINPSHDNIQIISDIIYIPTGETYLSYDITEYGNNRMIHAFMRLSQYIERDIPKVARILKIDGNYAIINMGAQQGIKIGQILKILNSPDLPNKFFSIKTIDPAWEIASAKVVELGENISKISFKPLDKVVFNMVQQNQSIIIESRGK